MLPEKMPFRLSPMREGVTELTLNGAITNARGVGSRAGKCQEPVLFVSVPASLGALRSFRE
jgi:hypothetical protein